MTDNYNFSPEAKKQSLIFLQDIIKRMANNSLKVKLFCVGFLSILSTFQNKLELNILIFIILIIIFSISCYFDAYYLYFERKFRELYNQKAEANVYENENFFVIKPDIVLKEIFKTILSISIWLPYLGFLLISLCIIYLKY